jgi:hypothetical protein
MLKYDFVMSVFGFSLIRDQLLSHNLIGRSIHDSKMPTVQPLHSLTQQQLLKVVSSKTVAHFTLTNFVTHNEVQLMQFLKQHFRFQSARPPRCTGYFYKLSISNFPTDKTHIKWCTTKIFYR